MIRTGEQYRQGLRDGREVYVDGARVDEVTMHPQFRPIVDVRARIYDLAHEEKTRDIMTYEEGGERFAVGLQLPKSRAHWEAKRNAVDLVMKEVMALIRVQDEDGEYIFEKDEDDVYVHHLRLLKRTWEQMRDGDLLAESVKYTDTHNLSFHYDPYNFDSKPERSFFRQILSILNTDPNDVETFLFTGGLTDPNKSDFHFEYLGEDQRYHRYFPDFVLVKKTGEFYIVEVKSEKERGEKTVEAKKKAVERVQKMQPDKFKYNIIYASVGTISAEKTRAIKDWVRANK